MIGWKSVFSAGATKFFVYIRRVFEMPQLPISLSADIIAKLNEIAQVENKELIAAGAEPTIKAATIAARMVKSNIRMYKKTEEEQ